jgi:hypothetical protein
MLLLNPSRSAQRCLCRGSCFQARSIAAPIQDCRPRCSRLWSLGIRTPSAWRTWELRIDLGRPLESSMGWHDFSVRFRIGVGCSSYSDAISSFSPFFWCNWEFDCGRRAKTGVLFRTECPLVQRDCSTLPVPQRVCYSLKCTNGFILATVDENQGRSNLTANLERK